MIGSSYRLKRVIFYESYLTLYCVYLNPGLTFQLSSLDAHHNTPPALSGIYRLYSDISGWFFFNPRIMSFFILLINVVISVLYNRFYRSADVAPSVILVFTNFFQIAPHRSPTIIYRTVIVCVISSMWFNGGCFD